MKSSSKSFDHLLHPYIFALKEGQKIRDDYLDYSLLLWQVGPDILPSPGRSQVSNPLVQVLKR